MKSNLHCCSNAEKIQIYCLLSRTSNVCDVEKNRLKLLMIVVEICFFFSFFVETLATTICVIFQLNLLNIIILFFVKQRTASSNHD